MLHPVKAYLRDSSVCQQPAILVSTGKNALISARRGEPDPSRYNQRTDENGYGYDNLSRYSDTASWRLDKYDFVKPLSKWRAYGSYFT